MISVEFSGAYLTVVDAYEIKAMPMKATATKMPCKITKLDEIKDDRTYLKYIPYLN